MIDRQQCAIGGGGLSICPEHAHTLERLAAMEKGVSGVESNIKEMVDRLGSMRDTTVAEFRLMRNDMVEGILKRHSTGVVWAISILSGLVCALAATLFTHLSH